MKKINKLSLTICLVCLLISSQLFSEKLILNPKLILDVITGELYQSQILVEDKIIIKIEEDLSQKYRNIKLVDLPELTLIPGLMDSHVHLIGNTKLKAVSYTHLRAHET